MQGKTKLLVAIPQISPQWLEQLMGPEWKVIRPFAIINGRYDLILISGDLNRRELDANPVRWGDWINECLSCRLLPEGKLTSI